MGVQPYEHYDGVGPLPGTSSETSVAKLPDERKAEERSGVAHAAAAAAAAGPLAQAAIANLGTQVRRVDDLGDPTSSAQKAAEREREGQEAADVKVCRFFCFFFCGFAARRNSALLSQGHVMATFFFFSSHAERCCGLEVQRRGGERSRLGYEGRTQG